VSVRRACMYVVLEDLGRGIDFTGTITATAGQDSAVRAEDRDVEVGAAVECRIDSPAVNSTVGGVVPHPYDDAVSALFVQQDERSRRGWLGDVGFGRVRRSGPHATGDDQCRQHAEYSSVVPT